MSITPSDKQLEAIRKISRWFKNDTTTQQVFRLFGFAGTGKSTVLKLVLEDLDLEPHQRGSGVDVNFDDLGNPSVSQSGCVPGVVTATFTGKAALVLRRKGTPARTIHSLIYSVTEATEEEVRAAVEEIKVAERAALELTGAERLTAEALIEAKRQAVKAMKQPRFSLNPDSDAAHCKLIVLDEVSMVGPEMARDLLSFGKPILVLGDPGQLPPIKGEGAFTQQEPDVMLTEIHRQAAESAIIRLATLARQGQPIAMGQYDDLVWKLGKSDVGPAQLLRGGQVICGLNATRFMLNNAMRSTAGYHSRLPAGPAEKVICLKNQADLGLINGMFLQIEDAIDEGELFFSAVVTDEDGASISRNGRDRERIRIYKGHFDDHWQFDKDRADRDWKAKKNYSEATFGYAITCHKAQGSQWENVIVWDDGLGRTQEDRNRWMYTAITRAEKGLVILG